MSLTKAEALRFLKQFNRQKVKSVMKYPMHWFKDGRRVEARIVDLNRDTWQATVRSPDPFDSGEVEYKIAYDQLKANMPEATHTFTHSSMYGSYATECAIVRGGKERAQIQYFDPFLFEVSQMSIAVKDLTPIQDEKTKILEAFKVAMEGHQYGVDAWDNAYAWFKAGWHASQER